MLLGLRLGAGSEQLRLEIGDAGAQRLRRSFDFLQCKVLRDVLRAVPVVRDHVEDGHALDAGAIVRQRHLPQEFRVGIGDIDEMQTTQQLESLPMCVVHHEHRSAMIALGVAGAHVLQVAAKDRKGDARR